MIFDQANQKESQAVEALVPMVDLFAVLAIVFMIYATDEIKITEMTTANKIQEVEREVEEKIQEIVRSIRKRSPSRSGKRGGKKHYKKLRISERKKQMS